MCDNYSFIDSPEFKSFFDEYQTADTMTLRLKQFSGLPFDKDLATTQIECRRKARKKIPELADKLAYPTNVSIEQCSSETLAKFHAGLFAGCDKVVDLTCGLGIDTFYISQQVRSIVSVDAAETVVAAARHNMSRLGRNNVKPVCSRAEDFLKDCPDDVFSAAFIDPSRRTTDDRASRSYAIKDTVPNLDTIIPSLERRCQFIVVKASPMVDITQTITDFPGITEIWVLSVRNECKELLFRIDFPQRKADMQIHCIDFTKDGVRDFSFNKQDRRGEVSNVQPTRNQYLHVPNASIMKAGAYDAVACHYGIGRIAANSHLYVSDSPIPEFPGRQFTICEVLSMSKQDVKRLKSITATANIACRNFPLSPDNLRKRLKLSDGGSYYIHATTLADNSKVLILCQAVNA